MPLDERIEQLLDWWEELNEQGRRISPEELCRDCPELVETVRRQLRILQATHWLEEPLDAPDSERQGNSQATTKNEPQLTDRFQAGDEPVPRYRLVERLGRGGYGEVWKAIGPGNFPLAIKLVPLTAEAGPVELRALDAMREVRHPHLLSTFGAWQKENVLIIAMELADRTLLARLQEAVSQGHRGIPAQELVQHLVDASEGIDFLNESCHGLEGQDTLGIQHRDIKPQNLLLVGGRVKVGDFGLARVLTHTVTGHTGSLTPAYAAPEFFNGQTFRQSDQYSLAVTYCHLRGGRLPYTGTPAQIMAGHLLRPPDLTMLPENERPAVLKALAKQSADRWPSCQAFVAEVAKAVGMSEQEEIGTASLSRATQPFEKAGEQQTEIPTNQPTPRKAKDFVSGPALSQRKNKRTRLAIAVLLGLLALAVLAFFLQPMPGIYLVDMTPRNFDASAFEPWCNMMVHGKQTPHGLGLHPRDKSWAYVAYDLDRRFQVFKATAAIADAVDNGKPKEGGGPFTFTVIGDGKLLWQSQPLQKHGQVDSCQVSVDGLSRLILQVHCPGQPTDAEPVWVEPRLTGSQKSYPEDFYVKNGEIDKAANTQNTYVVTLLGTWYARVGPMWNEFTFSADGKVTAAAGVRTGKWTFEKQRKRVLINWDAPGTWESLDLPLNPKGTAGASWQGFDVRSVKVNDSWPEQFAWRTPSTFLVHLTPRKFEAVEFGPSPNSILNGKQTLRSLKLYPLKNGRGSVTYDLNKRFRLFRTMAAILNSANPGGGSAILLTFSVIGDGKLLWQSDPLKHGGQVEACEVSVSDVSELVLQVDCPGPSDFAHAVWIEPSLYK
jgi:serine/threonine protein kinase